MNLQLCRRVLNGLLAVVPLVMVPLSLQASHAPTPPVPPLAWSDCGDGFQCATAAVPLDYDHPRGKKIELALIRKPARDQQHRIGHLFFHQGGTGQNVDVVRALPPFVFDLFSRFDFVGFDQRGVGHSSPAVVSCGAHPAYVLPLPRPQTVEEHTFQREVRDYVNRCEQLNHELLPHLSSANVARDVDLLRAAVGDEKLTYLGVSSGTLAGAMYVSLFPGRARAMLLDSPVDVRTYVRKPIEDWLEYTASHEEALKRFLAACAANSTGCGFGGGDPSAALDKLLAELDLRPMPSTDTSVAGPLTGDHVRFGLAAAMRRRMLWPVLAQALARVEQRDPTMMLQFVGPLGNGTSDDTDAFLTALYAVDQQYPRLPPQFYFNLAARSYSKFPHFWFSSGYADLVHSRWRATDHDASQGEVHNPAHAKPVLIIGVTHDPATPYVQAQRLTADLGNARLLTFDADGHFAMGSFDSCVISSALAYLEDGTLPPNGAVCVQQGEPFPTAATPRARQSLQSDAPFFPMESGVHR